MNALRIKMTKREETGFQGKKLRDDVVKWGTGWRYYRYQTYYEERR